MTRREPVVTIAPIRARQVYAKSVLTRVNVFRALVDVSTLVRTHLNVTVGANARERADEVFARELTVVCRRHAFVHVCICTCPITITT